jgi:hypothetical protein
MSRVYNRFQDVPWRKTHAIKVPWRKTHDIKVPWRKTHVIKGSAEHWSEVN